MRPEQTSLIGKEATVIKSRNSQLIGIQGRVTDETKNTIIIEGKTIIKDHVTIKVGTTIIDGEKLTKTTAERIKVKK